MARRPIRIRTDLEILARPDDVELLRAVQSGRVLRGLSGGETAIMARHYLDGESIRFQLRWLVRDELIVMTISGPPSLAPRGRRLLAVANGEIAPPAPD